MTAESFETPEDLRDFRIKLTRHPGGGSGRTFQDQLSLEGRFHEPGGILFRFPQFHRRVFIRQNRQAQSFMIPKSGDVVDIGITAAFQEFRQPQ